MARFSLGVRTSNTSAGAATVEIINSSNTKEAFIKAVSVTTNTAAAFVVGFGRPAAAGITPTSPVALLDEMGLATGLVTTALAWGTGPTVPAAFLRRFGGTNVVGSGTIWQFLGKGFRLAPLGTAVLWTISSTSNVFDVIVEVEQDVNVISNP
jgi:hypothetical protein